MINGNPNPTVGKDEYYTLVDYSLGLAYLDVSSKYTWRIKKKVRGAWKDITKEPPKTGISVPFKFGEAVIGEEFTIEVYKETKNIFTQKNETHKMGEIIVIPKSSKVPKITKVVLFNRGARDINKASYTDRLIARAYCVGMFNTTIDFHLWEDDAAGGGHHAEINKNNRSNRVYSARVNRDGIAEVEISLSADQRVLRQIANRMMMSGDKDEGKYHEFYVTASYQGKILKANEKNVAVENPDYKQKPKEYTPKFPATPASRTPTQQDKEDKIKAAYFVNDKNQKLVKTTVGEEVKVQIITQGMVGKHLQYRVWEYDAGKHDEIYSSPRLKVVGNIMTHVSGFKITKERFQKGVDLPYGDPDEQVQNYFIEVLPLDISVSSKKFGIDTSVGLMTVAVEKTRTPTKVGKVERKEGNGKCPRCKTLTLLELNEVFPSASLSEKSEIMNAFNLANTKFGLDSCQQKAHFFAQVLQEIGESIDVKNGENLNYSAEALPMHFSKFRVDPNKKYNKITNGPNSLAFKYGRSIQNNYTANQEMIANIAYANKEGNGGMNSGDGWKYRGRGIIQITFKNKYIKINDRIKSDYPEYKIAIDANNINNLDEGTVASMAYWKEYGCQAIAEKGYVRKYLDLIVDIINPATDSRNSRWENLKKCVKIFKVEECTGEKNETSKDSNESILEEMKELVDRHIPYSQSGERASLSEKGLKNLDCSETVGIYLHKLGVMPTLVAIHTGIMTNQTSFRKAIGSDAIDFVRGSENSDFVPQRGDIFVWRKSNGVGHTGIVYSYDENKDLVTILEAIGSVGSADETTNKNNGGHTGKGMSRTAIYKRSGKALFAHSGWVGYFRPKNYTKKL